jgi:hypothetical protein
MLERINRVFIRSFGCPRRPGVGAERPTGSAEDARGDPIKRQSFTASHLAFLGNTRARTEWFWLGSQQMSPPAALLPQIAPAGGAIPHRARHGSCHAPGHHTAIFPCPCGPPEPKRHGPKNSPCTSKRSEPRTPPFPRPPARAVHGSASPAQGARFLILRPSLLRQTARWHALEGRCQKWLGCTWHARSPHDRTSAPQPLPPTRPAP